MSTFVRRELPVSMTRLDQRYSQLNHNHDNTYSHLGHTHTVDQITGVFGMYDQRSIAIEPVYTTVGQVYEVIQDGWLRISLTAQEGITVLSVPLSWFDNRIPDYDSQASWTKESVIVRHDNSYWLCLKNATVSNPTHAPGSTGNNWLYLPPWLPSVAVAHCMSGGGDDECSNELVIPVRAGEQFVSGAIRNGKGIAKQMRGIGYSQIMNQARLQYLPPVYQTTAVGLKITDRTLGDDVYRYDNYRQILTATPLLWA